MKKILVLIMAVMISLSTACGKKEEEKKTEESNGGTQTQTPIVEIPAEDDLGLTEEDLAKITNEIKISAKEDDKKTNVEVTYANNSTKDYKVNKIKFSIEIKEKGPISVIKEVNAVIKPGGTKKIEFEIDAAIADISTEDMKINLEVIS